MSSPDLGRLAKLRQVLRLAAHGKGIAASIVEAFRESKIEEEREMVRRILLGIPVEQSVAGLVSRDDRSRDVLLYVVNQAKVNAVEASRRADKLSSLFEHWVWMKKQRVVEQRIMETRSILVSGILGGVTAMISALAPVLATFQLTLGDATTSDQPCLPRHPLRHPGGIFSRVLLLSWESLCERDRLRARVLSGELLLHTAHRRLLTGWRLNISSA